MNSFIKICFNFAIPGLYFDDNAIVRDFYPVGAHELDHIDIDQGPLVGKMVGAKLVMLAEQAPPEEFVVVKSLFL